MAAPILIEQYYLVLELAWSQLAKLPPKLEDYYAIKYIEYKHEKICGLL